MASRCFRDVGIGNASRHVWPLVDDSLGSTVCGWDFCKENGGKGREVFGTLEAVYQEG